MRTKQPLCCQKHHNILFRVVGHFSNEKLFSQIEYFGLSFLDYVELSIVIDDCDFLTKAIEIFWILTKLWKNRLQLLVLLAMGKLNQAGLSHLHGLEELNYKLPEL